LAGTEKPCRALIVTRCINHSALLGSVPQLATWLSPLFADAFQDPGELQGFVLYLPQLDVDGRSASANNEGEHDALQALMQHGSAWIGRTGSTPVYASD
jgi:hypothetical protein